MSFYRLFVRSNRIPPCYEYIWFDSHTAVLVPWLSVHTLAFCPNNRPTALFECAATWTMFSSWPTSTLKSYKRCFWTLAAYFWVLPGHWTLPFLGLVRGSSLSGCWPWTAAPNSCVASLDFDSRSTIESSWSDSPRAWT